MAEAFDRTRMDLILQQLLDRLEGDWLLIGGALVALWLSPRRSTEDIDIIGLGGSMDERYALMDLAMDLGLPVEAINSAADFFVRKIPGWRQQLVPFRQGARGRALRPTATLFIRLKLGRLSEQDLLDCLAVLDADELQAEVDVPGLTAAIDALPTADDQALAARRRALRERLTRA